MGQINQWCRVVMNAETLRLIRGIRPEERNVLEISGTAWSDLIPFKSYQSRCYPEIDICARPLEGKFDLIIAEQVFEHLRYPYRAGKNLYAMLNPGGYLLLTTPFLIKVHPIPHDCSRWTEEGIKFFMEECGFDLNRITTGSWGNRLCVTENFATWPDYVAGVHPLDNEPEFPLVVWALAQKADTAVQRVTSKNTAARNTADLSYQERVFPHSHTAWPLVVSFYGDGERWLGHALVDFFDSVALTGPRTELCRIMTEEKSDKGSGYHNYTLLYHFLFRHRRYEITSVFELGLGTNFSDVPSNMGECGVPGASLRGWRRYFPRAKIFGADIDARILFSEKRISTYYVDQLCDNAVDNLWRKLPNERFDIIIDDGLHSFDANTTFFRSSVQKLKSNGYYIIEDIIIDPDNLNKYHEFFSSRPESGVIIRIPNHLNNVDNCLGIFRNDGLHQGACEEQGPSNGHAAEPAFAVERAKLEIETLRAECLNLQSIVAQEGAASDAVAGERDAAIAKLNQTISERDGLAAAATRWFDAVIAVTPDHNPLAWAPGKRHWRWTNLARHLNGEYRRRPPIALANRARDAGKWELAVRYYRDALDVEPEDPQIWLQCGLALEKAGKTPEAKIAYQRSRDLIARRRALA